MNIAHLLDSFRDKSKVRLLGELTNEKTLFLSLTETILNNNIVDPEIQMECFNIIRCDKSERIGGGVCFYLKKSINYTTLLSYSNSICEVLIVKFTNPDLILVTMYRPPNATAASFNDIVSQTEHKICALNGPLPEVIIMGDFNFPGVQWDSTISETNEHLSCLVGLRDFLYLDQMITEPTRKLNTLDLLFCNESIIEIDETVISDHNIIHVNSYLKIMDKSDPKVMNPSESVFEQINFFKANWNTIVQKISASNLSNSIQHLHTEDALNLFVRTIGDICIKNAPLKK